MGSQTEEERKMRDIFMKEDEEILFKVKEIAMGQNHMLALGSDKMAKKDNVFVQYDAENIFR